MFWRFHVNSGQIYIVYIFLLSVAWFLLNRPSRFNYIAGGFLVGITASFRPSFILLFIPFLICQRYVFLLGGILGLLFNLSLSYAVVGASIWNKYILAMFGMTGFINFNTYPALQDRIIPSPDIVYPKIVESFDFLVRNPLEYYLDNTSLFDVLNAIGLSNKREILVASFVLTLTFLILYFIRYTWKNKDINSLFLFGVSICLIGDFFIPVGRYSYYDVQMILPLLIVASKTDTINLIDNKLIPFLLLGLLLSIGSFFWIPRFLFFSSFLIAFYLIITLLIFLRQNHKQHDRILD